MEIAIGRMARIERSAGLDDVRAFPVQPVLMKSLHEAVDLVEIAADRRVERGQDRFVENLRSNGVYVPVQLACFDEPAEFVLGIEYGTQAHQARFGVDQR